MNLDRVGLVLERRGEPRFRLEQVRRAAFSDGASSYDQVWALPADLRKALGEEARWLSFSPRKIQISGDGRARKALIEIAGGGFIETVLLRPSPRRWTACISSQAGCAVACSFCATGLMGLSRNLSEEEISDQVLFWRQYMRGEGLPGRLDNVVYMGMGEPFANYDNVARSLKALMDQKTFGIGARHIAVSTAGIAPRIEAFARDFPQVNLALSLHAASDALRTRLVPLNRAYPLESLGRALSRYLSETSRKVFLEYVLLKGENDSPADARALIRYVNETGPLQLLHVNLIVFNPTDTPHRPCSEQEARRFQALLRNAGLKATVRQNLGRDIDGACGQLVIGDSNARRNSGLPAVGA